MFEEMDELYTNSINKLKYYLQHIHRIFNFRVYGDDLK